MSITPLLAAILITFTLADAFFGASAISHLRANALPGWRAPKVAIAVYLALTLLFLGLAAVSLFALP